MSFDQLVTRMNAVADLNKALPSDAAGAADDKKIKDAAGEEGKNVSAGESKSAAAIADDKDGEGEGDAGADGADGGDGGGEGDESDLNDDPEKKKGEGDGEGAPMAKAFSLQLDDGTVLEAFDGAEMLKSFGARMDGAEAGFAATRDQFLKSMNVAVDLLSSQGQLIKDQASLVKAQATQLTEQGTLLKSLQERVEQLADSGRGRKSTVNVNDKPLATEDPLAKALDPNAMQPQQILAKAQDAMKAGRISGTEASGIETRLNMGLAIDPAVLAKIQS